MPQKLLCFIRTWFRESVLFLLKPMRVFLTKEVAVSCARMLALASICALLGSTIILHGTPKAFAMQAEPPADFSFYMTSSSTAQAYNLGCNQGHFDATWNGGVNSSVVLDFGATLSNGTGTGLFNNSSTVSAAQVEAIAENFARGYYVCTGGDTTTTLLLGIGTNNSAGDVSYSGGVDLATWVKQAEASVTASGYGSQVAVVGANDIEPGWWSASGTMAWVQGYASVPNSTYINFGSADGCPQSSANNGSCNNGWNQYDVYYVSWGAAPAQTAPEIYYAPQALQWEMISLYGQNNQGSRVWFKGPWDENDLASSTFTPTQAWDTFWNDLNSNSSTAQNFTFAYQIHYE